MQMDCRIFCFPMYLSSPFVVQHAWQCQSRNHSVRMTTTYLKSLIWCTDSDVADVLEIVVVIDLKWNILSSMRTKWFFQQGKDISSQRNSQTQYMYVAEWWYAFISNPLFALPAGLSAMFYKFLSPILDTVAHISLRWIHKSPVYFSVLKVSS